MRRFLIGPLTAALLAAPSTAAEPLWSQLVPERQAAIEPQGGYELKAEHGPWLIVAATFSGDGAADQARELAVELRRDYNLRAYVHRMSFDLSDDAPISGLDAYGRPRRAKFRRGDEVTEFAVLVGDFPAVDDVEAQRTLTQIKQVEPKTLTGKERDTTSQNLAGWRTLKNAIMRRRGEAEKLGPMSSAFISRNPMLPAEYFVPKGVDEQVEAMNRGLEFSLLDAPRRYTVKVATFRGRSSLLSAASDGSATGFSDDNNILHIAASNAHKLTLALREKGWEAYEFHDYDESIVTVGSFDTVAERTLDGREVPTREVDIILRVFGAAHEPVFTDARALATQHKAEELKQKFSQVFAQQHGQIASGFHPKSLIGIPFDIFPSVMEAPKRSISTAYVRTAQ
jgi:hypothetical protein